MGRILAGFRVVRVNPKVGTFVALFHGATAVAESAPYWGSAGR